MTVTDSGVGRLAFVALWALFGIELLGRHAKDVVALDADPVKECLFGFRRLGGFFLLLCIRWVRAAAHARILSRGRCAFGIRDGLSRIKNSRAAMLVENRLTS